jgi:hypothetical protein
MPKIVRLPRPTAPPKPEADADGMPAILRDEELARVLALYRDDSEASAFYLPDPVADGPEPEEDPALIAAHAAALERWRSTPAGDAASADYAEEAALRLVSIFPNAKVNALRFAAALAEDCNHVTADIVRHVLTIIRRTAKSLPPIATIREMASAERHARHRLLAALDGYGPRRERLLAEDAEAFARAAAASGLEPADLATVWHRLTAGAYWFVPRLGDCARRDVRAVFSRIAAGDPAAAEWCRDFAAALRAHAAEEPGRDAPAAMWSAWADRRPDFTITA